MMLWNVGMLAYGYVDMDVGPFIGFTGRLNVTGHSSLRPKLQRPAQQQFKRRVGPELR